MKKCSVLASV